MIVNLFSNPLHSQLMDPLLTLLLEQHMVRIIYKHHYSLGFYDDFANGTFGTIKKGIKRPLSNFNFKFCSKVISARSSSTGYLVSVIQEREERGDSDIEEEPSSLRYGV